MLSLDEGRRGGHAIEFALLVPPLLLMLFGTVELGWMMVNKTFLSNAVVYGARVGSVVPQGSGQDPGLVAEQAAAALWPLPGVVRFEATIGGQPESVRLAGEVDFIGLTGLGPGSSTLYANMTVVRSDQPD